MDRLFPSLSPAPNPFLKLQSRYLVLATYLLASFVLGIAYAQLTLWQILPWERNDPIAMPILSIAIWTVLTGVILQVGRRQGLQLTHLFGDGLTRFSWVQAGLLVASLLVFSFGSSSVVFYVVSLGFPGYAAQLLETTVMPGGGISSQPQLYDGLMLFLLLIYAPLVEELVFRGILLQRWGMKWGLRWGIVSSSLLFGLLHHNNPLGLTLFGFVMGLLYVRTRSLWVPVICHSLNNLAAVGLDQLSQWVTAGQTPTVAEVQASWWIGLVLMAVSAPFVVWFMRRSWPQPAADIPYLSNAHQAHASRPMAHLDERRRRP